MHTDRIIIFLFKDGVEGEERVANIMLIAITFFKETVYFHSFFDVIKSLVYYYFNGLTIMELSLNPE